MRIKRIVFVLLLSACISASAQQAYKLRLLDNWNNTNLTSNPGMEGQIWNELTGWVDTATGKEYIIMGSIDSIYFFDVSDPQQIKLCEVEWGLNRVINRDVETYSHYVYCVSDNGPPGKLQIFDLSHLPDSVHKVYESDTFGFNTHSLFINPESKRLYMCINRIPGQIIGMDILSIDTPDKPSFLGRLQTSPSACQRVHEVYVKNDTAYCSCEYRGLYVYDLTDLNNQRLLGGISPPYPYNGYNHTCWTDSSNSFIAFTDELPQGQPIKIYRIRELGDMTYLTHFNTHTGATPHNVFWISTKLYVSWYHDGVYIFDMKNPRLPEVYAYYDTYHQNAAGDYSGFKGCWGVYPFLPSGVIAASDMSNGLFLLTYDSSVVLNTPERIKSDIEFNLHPNPYNSYINLSISSKLNESAVVSVYDLQGRILYTSTYELQNGENDIKLESISELTNGVYIVELKTAKTELRQKIVKQ